LLSKNIPLEEIPFKNEADLQAQLNTLLPPIEVFSSTTILLQDAENIFEMQPAKRLEVLKNVFGLMGIEETKEIVKDKRNEVKYQIKAYQDTSHTEGKLSSGLQGMLALFRKLQEFREITEYLSSSLETIEELEGFSQQLGIQNFELDEKLTEFLPSIAEFLKTKRYEIHSFDFSKHSFIFEKFIFNSFNDIIYSSLQFVYKSMEKFPVTKWLFSEN